MKESTIWLSWYVMLLSPPLMIAGLLAEDWITALVSDGSLFATKRQR